MKTAYKVMVRMMKERKLTLALAESMTCGLAAFRLSSAIGTTEVLRGSVICYHEQVKKSLLKVPASLIAKYTAESQQVTDALAKKLQFLINADIYAAITGLASEGGSETPQKPVGSVFISVVFGKKIFREKKVFRGSPKEIKTKACNALYDMIIHIIK